MHPSCCSLVAETCVFFNETEGWTKHLTNVSFICKKETPPFTKPNSSHHHKHIHSLQQNAVNTVRENITILDIKAGSSHSKYCTLYTLALTCYSKMNAVNNRFLCLFCWENKTLTYVHRVALQKVSLVNSWYRTKKQTTDTTVQLRFTVLYRLK